MEIPAARSAAFVALVVVFAMGLNPKRDIHALPSPLDRQTSPRFALTDVMDASRPVTNAAFKGQVYVVNVWGTWCQACREEHEALLEIAQQKVVPIIGLVYMDQRDKAQAVARAIGQPLHRGCLRHGRHGRRSTGACTVRPKPSWSMPAAR